MKLIFINPSKTAEASDHVVNMALFWLVSVLEENGYKSKIYTVLGNDFEQEIDRIVQEAQPEWIGITCKWWNTLYSVTEISKVIRKKYPNIKIFSGGHTATIFAKEFMEKNIVDAVLMGDSEKTIIELVEGKVGPGIATQNTCDFSERDFQCENILKNNYELKGIDEYIDRPELVMAYVWTGRGCSHNCFYCAENVHTAKKIFGKRIPFVRSPENVANDIKKFGKRSHIIFDYEFPSFLETESYMEELFSRFSLEKDYRCYFFSWGLPSKGLIDLFSKRFSYSCICIDIQCFSEKLREKLSDEKLIKPSFSNKEFEEIIEYANKKENVIIDITGIVGYPYETEADREETLKYILELHRRFRCVRDARPSPLHVIPGTDMTLSDEYYNLFVERRSYDDFYRFTKEAFEKKLKYYDKNRNEHPYGVYPKENPLTIVNFMEEFDKVINEVRQHEILVTVDEEEDFIKVHIEDKYNPLKSIIETIQKLDQEIDISSKKLIVSLGYFTWIHNEWIDYTSESGENCATLLGSGRSPEMLEKKCMDYFRKFESVEIVDSQNSCWGILRKVVSKLPCS